MCFQIEPPWPKEDESLPNHLTFLLNVQKATFHWSVRDFCGVCVQQYFFQVSKYSAIMWHELIYLNKRSLAYSTLESPLAAGFRLGSIRLRFFSVSVFLPDGSNLRLSGGQTKYQVQDLWPDSERFGERLAAWKGRIGSLGEAWQGQSCPPRAIQIWSMIKSFVVEFAGCFETLEWFHRIIYKL